MPYSGQQHEDIPNPYAPKPNPTGWTPDEIAALQCRLDKQLGPEYLLSRQGPGGQTLHYIPAEKVINLANEIFGFNGWSSSIQNVHIDYVDENSSGKVTMGCSIICRVTLKDGTYHEDLGYGEIKNAPSKAAAFEKSKKEAATDALKRALKNFGSVLGNCLYDKSYLKEVAKVKSAPARWDADDLHRHASVMVKPDPSIKKEGLINTSSVNAATTRTTSDVNDAPARANAAQQRARMEEDEFGADDFDDMDFINPDEVCLDDQESITAPMVMQPTNRNQGIRPAAAARQNSTSTAHNGKPVNGQMTTQNGHGRPIPSHPQPQQRHAMPVQHQITTTGAPNAPQPYPRPQVKGQQPQSTNISSISHATNPSKPQHIPPHPPNAAIPQSNNAPPKQHDPPVGFFSAKAALPIADADGPPPPLGANAPAFNPHTPGQMRRTSGFDHSRSGKVLRQEVVATTSKSIGAGPSAGVVPGLAQDRPTNFINPQADLNRRIGMPPGIVASPLANRSTAFKAPSIANAKRSFDATNRPPLSDVSNMQSGNSGTDSLAKKPKMATNDQNTTANQAVA